MGTSSTSTARPDQLTLYGFVIIATHPVFGAWVYDASELGRLTSGEEAARHAEALNALADAAGDGMTYRPAAVTA